MSAIDQFLKNNEEYAGSFSNGSLPRPPAKHIAVVVCMDARMETGALLGLQAGDANIIRNAGGVVTDDVIRSLTVSQHLLGTREIMLIHHTDCGMEAATDEGFKQQVYDETGVKPDFPIGTFTDLEGSVRDSIRRIKNCPFILHKEHIRGFIYDVFSGKLNEVKTGQ